MADIHERSLWNEYREAYGHCLGATSTDVAPWHVVPADDKENARAGWYRALFWTPLESLKLHYPEVDGKRRRALLAIRKQLNT